MAFSVPNEDVIKALEKDKSSSNDETIYQLIQKVNVAIHLISNINVVLLESNWVYNYAALLKSKMDIIFEKTIENYIIIEQIEKQKKQLKKNIRFSHETPLAEYLKKLIFIRTVLQVIEKMEGLINDIEVKIIKVNAGYLSVVKKKLEKFKRLFSESDKTLKKQGFTFNASAPKSSEIFKNIKKKKSFGFKLQNTLSPFDIQCEESSNDIECESPFNDKDDIECENPSDDIVRDDDDDDDIECEKTDEETEWDMENPGLKEFDVKWNMVEHQLKHEVVRSVWNLSYSEKHVPDFILDSIQRLIKTIDQVVINSTSGNVVLENIKNIRQDLIKVGFIVFNHLSFLEKLNLSIIIEEPVLFPEYTIEMQNIFVKIVDTYRKTNNILYPSIRVYNRVEAFINNLWNSNMDVKRNCIKLFFELVIAHYIKSNQTNILLFGIHQDAKANRFTNEVYTNINNIYTTNILLNHQALVEFSSKYLETLTPVQSITPQKVRRIVKKGII